MNAVSEFLDILRANKSGDPKGIYSVCSAHEGVIRASMKQALDDDSLLLVESTSNQVDQFGGYTGMTPAAFVSYMHRLADGVGFPVHRLLLGGDHLGPNAWQDRKAEEAMRKSHGLVRQYVAAGYQKIHLDASMYLADDDGDRSNPLADAVVAERAAALCATAEKARKELPADAPAPVYVIGTEVPIPGGAMEHEEILAVTPAADARRTVEVTREAFLRENLEDAWERVCGVVVQPGVEYGDDQVFDYDPAAAGDLIGALDDKPSLVFEAHSTDYQTLAGLTALTEGHFCIQKVGPWLTYAWREALFGLSAIEDEIVEDNRRSRLQELMETVMIEDPKYWKKYYPGDEKEQYIKRKYSYSDRSRYYWPDKRLSSAVSTLFANLRETPPSPTLVSQYLPYHYHALRSGALRSDPEEMAEYSIRLVLRTYSSACRMNRGNQV